MFHTWYTIANTIIFLTMNSTFACKIIVFTYIYKQNVVDLQTRNSIKNEVEMHVQCPKVHKQGF